MDDHDVPCEISIEVIWFDEDIIELEVIVVAGAWRGRTCAYTVPQDLTSFSDNLDSFAIGAAESAEFAAGADNGIGLLGLRFYRIDRAGHIACHSRLASGRVPDEHRPEQVCQLAVEVRAEAEAVRRFARHLRELARTRTGRAVIALEASAE